MSTLNMLHNLRTEQENILRHIREMIDLERCRMDAETAWGVFDRLSDMLLNQMGDCNMTPSVSESEVSDAERMAIKLQQSYFHLYYELHSNQCTCKPDSAMACDVCKAQIKAKSTYREEM